MRKARVILPVLLLIAVFSLASCANRAQTGAAVGGATGALIGSTTGSWAIGGGIGAALGYIVGNEWDKYDEKMAGQSVSQNQRTTWTNKETGRTYTSVPGETYTRDGSTYKHVTIVDSSGNERKATLRKSPGSDKWEVVK